MDTLYRRWLIIKMIPRYGNSITTTIIADRLAAETLEAKSVRTIQRDLEELSLIFPITYEQDGRTFRWSWVTNAPRYDIPVMDPQTALTFCLADSYMAALLPKSSLRYLEPYFATARGILTENPDMPLSQWREKVRVIPKALEMDAPQIVDGVAEIVYEALLKGLRINANYRPREKSKAKEYPDLNPLGLVFMDQLVYLVATVKDHGNPIQFLLHRMVSATLLQTKVTEPPGFTLQNYIENGEFSYPMTQETIRLKANFDRDAAVYLRETPLKGTVSLTDIDEDTMQLEAEVLNSYQLRWWLRSFGDMVEVLEPDELREEFRKIAKSLKQIYR